MDRRLGAVGISVGLALTVAGPASAQSNSPAAAGPWTVVASGLDAPRGLVFAADGTLYVGEQGSGGDMCMDIPGGGQGCLGMTGGISSIKDGVVTRVVDGLPSMTSGQEVGGASDFAITPDGGFVVTMNLGGGPDMRAQFPPEIGAVLGTLSSAAADGKLTPIADLAQWEADNNPDKDDPGSSVDSNPYGVTIAKDGSYLVADAGGNDLLMVAADGTITLGAVFHASMEEIPAGMPAEPAGSADPAASVDPSAAADMMPMQAVPTAVTIGRDGAAYVSQLTGAPFTPGGSSIWRVVPGEDPTEYATGLTNAMDLAFGPDGTLWVVEFSHNGLLSGDVTGGLMSVPPGGGAATLVTTEGLMAPGGVAVDADGTVYVANGSVMAGGGSVVTLNQ